MQRYFSKEKKENTFVLNDSDVHHIINVMRMHDGDNIEVIYDKKIYLCKINVVNNSVNTTIIECKEYNVENKPYITLIVSLLKEQKLDIIFQKATELGVDEIILTSYERTIIHLEDSKLQSKISRWEKILKEASEQSMRIDIPKISYVNKKDLKNLAGLKILCSTIEKDMNIKKFLKNNTSCDKLNIAIGPEGGFSEKEEEEFEDYGFTKISLGNQILRVETVPMFVLSSIRYEYMER